MKSLFKLLLSATAGFVTAYGLMSFSEVNFSGKIAVNSLGIISIILITLSIFLYQKIKSLSTQNFSGEEEDEVEDKKYKLFADYSLLVHISFFLSILAISLSLITSQHIILTVISIIVLFLSLLLMFNMKHILQQVYPERNILSKTHPDFAKSVLDVADDGEKHVILDGLYKSQSLLNFALIAGIVLATIYSVSRENSQIFSIILMSIVLLIVNGKYLLVIRNK